MATEHAIDLATALTDGMTAHDLSSWAAALADDFVAEYPGAPSLDAAQARAFNQAFVDAFPDLRFTVHRVIVDGDLAVVHWTGGGTHTAPLATLSGQIIPPTGRAGSVTGVFLVETRNGRIVAERSYWDQMGLLAQLGLLPGA